MLHRAGAVIVELFVIMGGNVTPRKYIFQMLKKIGIHCHHIFKVAVDGTILHHQDFAVALDDGGFDLAGFFVEQDLVRQFAVNDLLPDFRNALGAKRVGRARPA